MQRPSNSEYAPFYSGYIERVTEEEILPVMQAQIEEFTTLFGQVPTDREDFRYAPGKWSIREVAGHLIDGERVFGYRSFCIARGETFSLPSFDENAYMVSAPYARVPLADLVNEFRLVRSANTTMFSQLDDDAWRRMGTANNSPVSVRALAFVMAGHFIHHLGILRERYGLTEG